MMSLTGNNTGVSITWNKNPYQGQFKEYVNTDTLDGKICSPYKIISQPAKEDNSVKYANDKMVFRTYRVGKEFYALYKSATDSLYSVNYSAMDEYPVK